MTDRNGEDTLGTVELEARPSSPGLLSTDTRYLVLAAVSKIMVLASGVVAVPVALTRLDDVDIARWTLVTSTLALATLLDLGMSSYTTNKTLARADTTDPYRTAWMNAQRVTLDLLVYSVAASLGAAGLIQMGLRVVGLPKLNVAGLMIVAAACASTILLSPWANVFVSCRQPRVFAMVQGVAGLTQCAASLLFYTSHSSSLNGMLLLSLVSVASAPALSIVLLAYRMPAAATSPQEAQARQGLVSLARCGSPYLAVSASGLAVVSLLPWAVAHIAGPSDAAEFTLGQRLFMALSGLVQALMVPAWIQIVGGEHEATDLHRRRRLVQTSLLLIPAVLPVSGLFSAAGFFAVEALHPSVNPSATQWLLWSVWLSVYTGSVPLYYLSIACRLERLQIRLALVTALTTCLFIVPLVAGWEATGAALARNLALLLGGVAPYAFTLWRFDERAARLEPEELDVAAPRSF